MMAVFRGAENRQLPAKGLANEEVWPGRKPCLYIYVHTYKHSTLRHRMPTVHTLYRYRWIGTYINYFKLHRLRLDLWCFKFLQNYIIVSIFLTDITDWNILLFSCRIILITVLIVGKQLIPEHLDLLFADRVPFSLVYTPRSERGGDVDSKSDKKWDSASCETVPFLLQAMQATWHPECFTCEMCHKELADLGFIKNQVLVASSKIRYRYLASWKIR